MVTHSHTLTHTVTQSPKTVHTQHTGSQTADWPIQKSDSHEVNCRSPVHLLPPGQPMREGSKGSQRSQGGAPSQFIEGEMGSEK